MGQFEAAWQEVQQGKKIQIVTLIEEPEEQGGHLGEMLLIMPDGEWRGCILDEEFSCIAAAAVQERPESRPQVLEITYGQAVYRVFNNPVADQGYKVIILGGGHISQPLVQLLAVLGYEVTVADDRFEFANARRFPGAKQVICNNFAKVLAEMEADAATAVIIVTRGHQYDLSCLRQAVTTQAGYIGMVGSRRKVEAALKALRAENVPEEIIEKVRAPIGLDLGGQRPEDIALSIAAEVAAVFNGGRCLPLSCLAKGGQHG